jgi:hypothetical protein
MSFDPRSLLPVAQRLTWVVALAGVAYLGWRYETLVVPDGAAPELGLAAGDHVLLDLRPTHFGPGDVVLHVDADGARHLARLVDGSTGVGASGTGVHRAIGADAVEREVHGHEVLARVLVVLPF